MSVGADSPRHGAGSSDLDRCVKQDRNADARRGRFDKISTLAYLERTPNIENASYGSVRAAVDRAREGAATKLESNIGMSVDQAYGYARSLLQDARGGVRLSIDGLWLYVDPAH